MSTSEKKIEQAKTLKRLRNFQRREKAIEEAELHRNLQDAQAKELHAEARLQWSVRKSSYRRERGVVIDASLYASAMENVEQMHALYEAERESVKQVSVERNQALTELLHCHANEKVADELYSELSARKEKERQRQEFLDVQVGENRSK